jgi:hypothetical protein
MYIIRKYSNGIALHDDDSGASRLLTADEIAKVDKKFIDDNSAVSLFVDSLPEGLSL